jgi:hypothetical protein
MMRAAAPDQVSAFEQTGWDEGRIPLRLRIGVTGHRHLDQPEALVAKVRERLAEIRKLFPSTETTPVKFVILSSLAEGADRLVVEEALEFLADAQVELEAVLPLSPEEYAKDFEATESREHFQRLLERAAVRTEMPPARTREEAYELAGRYVADESDVMIALWDGRQPQGQGGTAEVVGYAHRNEVPVLVVPTARPGSSQNGSESTAPNPQSEIRLAPPTTEAHQRLEEFNRGSTKHGELRQQIEREQARLDEITEGSPIHWQLMSVAAWALPRMVRADALAIFYQRWYYRLGSALYVLSALAVTAVAAQSQAGWDPVLALFEVGFMALLLVFFWLARRAGVHERWLGYRSLAEAFRSGLFITMTGSRNRPQDRTIDSWGVVDEPWFQRGFSESWRDRPEIEPESSSVGELRRFLIDAWIEDQIAYHQKAVGRFQRARTRLTRSVFLLFGITIVIGVLHSFGAVEGDFWPKLFVFLAVALPGFGAALTGVRDQRQYRVHEDRSQRTVSRLERLRRDLAAQTGLGSIQQLAVQIQAVIEAENLDWSGVIEFQELEMVI